MRVNELAQQICKLEKRLTLVWFGIFLNFTYKTRHPNFPFEETGFQSHTVKPGLEL